MKNIGVIGLGNELRHDDAVGVILLKNLKKQESRLPKNVKLMHGGISSMNLIHMITPFEIVIFIDAVRFGEKPGSIIFFKLEDVKSQKNTQKNDLTIHEDDVLKIVEFYKKIDNSCKNFFIFGIQPENTDFGEGLSYPIEKNLDTILQNLKKRIIKISDETKKN